MPDNNKTPEDLETLEEKIQAQQVKQKEASIQKNVQISAEFVGPMLGGIIIGYFLDKWLETEPLFLISLFLLGVTAGFVSIYKISQNIGGQVGFSELHDREKEAKNAPKDPESVNDSNNSNTKP